MDNKLDLSGTTEKQEVSKVDVLYWVGCSTSLNERNHKIATALVKLLQRAGVNFAVIGEKESCCGEFARRIGNEYMFTMQVEENIAQLKELDFTRIVTSCPHCYNTFKNEYPDFGGEFEVVHHTELLAELLSQGKLELSNSNYKKVAFHDPCYLGRYNDVYDQPREILHKIPALTMEEMECSKSRSLCCGGGGGGAWSEDKVETRLNRNRAEQAARTEVDIIATACPFCLLMLEDGVRSIGNDNLQVKDIAELLLESGN